MDDARPTVGGVGVHPHLPTGERLGILAQLLDRDREERDGLLLARCEQNVVLARRGLPFTQIVGQSHQRVRLSPHRRDAHHHLVPGPDSLDDAPGGVPDEIRIRNAGTAELLDYECHDSADLYSLQDELQASPR